MTTFVDREALRHVWYPVADVADLGKPEVGEPDAGELEVGEPDAGEPVLAVRLLNTDLVLWRGPDGGLIAAPDRCPHREAPLSIGTVRYGTLTCSYHGWGFGSEGRCSVVPSSGPGAAVPPAADLVCVQVQERYGLVWICLGQPLTSIPTIVQDVDPTFRRINTGVEAWTASAPRLVDNFMDFSHFPWVHAGTFGAAQDPIVPKLELGQLDNDFYGYEYEVEAANPEEAVAVSGSEADTVHRTMSTGFALPFIVRSTIRYDDGLEHILLLCSTPVDDLHTLFTFVVWRNDDFNTDPQEIVAFDRAIGAEDKAMLEQVPGTLPLGRVGLANVQSDKPSVEWRRRFAEMIGVTE